MEIVFRVQNAKPSPPTWPRNTVETLVSSVCIPSWLLPRSLLSLEWEVLADLHTLAKWPFFPQVLQRLLFAGHADLSCWSGKPQYGQLLLPLLLLSLDQFCLLPCL